MVYEVDAVSSKEGSVKIPGCIICGKELENVAEDVDINQPLNGLKFTSSGHFGSSFDPMNSSVWLELNFCEVCLVEKQEQGLILHVTQLPKGFTTEYVHEPWNRFKHG